MERQSYSQIPAPDQEPEKVEEQQKPIKETLPLMTCWQLTLAFRAAGFGWDEIS